MNNTVLNNLLREYEMKKYSAELAFENEKNSFYLSHPELNKINIELGKIAIDISKAILNQNIELSEKLKKDFDILKLKKEEMLNLIDIPIRSY